MKKQLLNKYCLPLALLIILGGLSSMISSCGGGGGGDGTPLSPTAPSGIVSLAGDGLIALGWNASAGATSYNLYVASSPGVTKSNYSSLPDGMKHAGVNSPFTLTGLKTAQATILLLRRRMEPERAENRASPRVSLQLVRVIL
jgi:hypothetical protein